MQSELGHLRMVVRNTIQKQTTNTIDCTEGVILEVAEAQCGGALKLAAAVDRGQVLKKGQPGYELFFFPKVDAGKALSFVTKDSTTKKREVTEEDHLNFTASIETFLDGGIDGMLGMAALGDTPANLTSTPSGMGADSGMPVTVLADKKKQLDKALQLAEKMQEAVQRVPKLPDRLLQASVSLAGSLEKATMFGHQVDFMLKFKKDQDGVPLSADLIAATKNKLDVQILAVVEEVKVTRALLGASSARSVA